MSIDNEVPIGGVLGDEEILDGVSAITPEAVADPEPESEVIATVSKIDAQKYLRGLKMQSNEDCSNTLQFTASIEQEMEVLKNPI